MPEDAPRPTQAAIRTDLGAIFVSMELSRRAWLITSLSPGGGEKMSKHSVPASEVSGLLRRFAELRRKAAARPGWDFPIYRHPGGRSGRLLDPPGAEVRRDREPRGRRRVDPDLAPASAGEDRPDRWRDPGAHPDGLQAWRAAGVFHGQGADAAGGGPPACLPRERRTLVGERVKHVNRIKGLLLPPLVFRAVGAHRMIRVTLASTRTPSTFASQ